MKLVIDNREKKLIEICNNLVKSEKSFSDIEIVFKNLELGDIIIEDSEGKELLIIERKTFDDVVASIKDGRYSEQGFRLNGYSNIHNHNIMYLIEGENINKHSSKQLIYSSTISLCYYKGFSIFRTLNTNETAFTILNWFLKINKEKDKKCFYTNNNCSPLEVNESENVVSYSSFIKKKKNENITKENFLDIVLCQIPSVNSVTASAISREYKNLSELINSLKENQNCLESIKYKTNKGQERKISKTCIKNIANFLIFL
jgi:crossover junction endonuclease MUS81